MELFATSHLQGLPLMAIPLYAYTPAYNRPRPSGEERNRLQGYELFITFKVTTSSSSARLTTCSFQRFPPYLPWSPPEPPAHWTEEDNWGLRNGACLSLKVLEKMRNALASRQRREMFNLKFRVVEDGKCLWVAKCDSGDRVTDRITCRTSTGKRHPW